MKFLEGEMGQSRVHRIEPEDKILGINSRAHIVRYRATINTGTGHTPIVEEMIDLHGEVARAFVQNLNDKSRSKFMLLGEGQCYAVENPNPILPNGLDRYPRKIHEH